MNMKPENRIVYETAAFNTMDVDCTSETVILPETEPAIMGTN